MTIDHDEPSCLIAAPVEAHSRTPVKALGVITILV
jgi:hypothetical protein